MILNIYVPNGIFNQNVYFFIKGLSQHGDTHLEHQHLGSRCEKTHYEAALILWEILSQELY